MMFLFKIFLILNFLNIPAFAYLGPGIGGGILAATLGIVIAILAGIFGLLWFPLKRVFKKKKNNKQNKID